MKREVKDGDDEELFYTTENSSSPFSLDERRRIRRMLQDDYYARRFKTTIKVWVVSIGAVAAFLVSIKVLLGDYLFRLIK